MHNLKHPPPLESVSWNTNKHPVIQCQGREEVMFFGVSAFGKSFWIKIRSESNQCHSWQLVMHIQQVSWLKVTESQYLSNTKSTTSFCQDIEVKTSFFKTSVTKCLEILPTDSSFKLIEHVSREMFIELHTLNCDQSFCSICFGQKIEEKREFYTAFLFSICCIFWPQQTKQKLWSRFKSSFNVNVCKKKKWT